MGKKFKKLLSIALTLAMLASFCAVPMTASAEQAPLKFGDDGKFKIVIFSDVQDQYPVHQRVLNIMRQAIERENPDLVVFLGDMTEINTKDVEDDYRRTVEQILGPVVEAGVPYSIVFGNHDNQSYYSGTVTDREDMLAVWQSIGDCRTTDPAPEITGAGTCKVPIYASNSNDLAFNLWMVDSNSYQNPLDGGSGYDNPHADQLAWMKANNDAGVNSLVFQHIPMPENYNLYVEDANGSKEYGGKKYKLELKEGVTGTAGEFPATIYADDNTGEFQTLKEMGNVLGVFTGHDHLNDYSGTYDGIDLTAVPGMTYFNYGDEAIRGYGVIELDENDLSDYDYHSVKFSTLDAELGTAPETVYDEYDEITYADLKQNGNKLGDSYTISGGHTFTYDSTSPSKSTIFKFRWTAGSKPGYQFSFDVGDEGNISHPFGVWIKRADQVAPNGAWHLKPNKEEFAVKMDSAIKQGETFDIEFGRLKVLEGDPKIVGQYYVYLKVNGKLIQEGYSNTDENGGYSSGNRYDCMVSNEIRFGGWGNGGDDVISEYVEPVIVEEYAAYDVVEYDDLITLGNAPEVQAGGVQIDDANSSYTWNVSEAAAKTNSVILKLRWTMETYDYFQIHLGGYGSSSNFAYRLNDNENWHDRGSGATAPITPATVTGDYYDFEVARLMVTAGVNKGKYYTYFKVDGEIIFEKYVSTDNANTANYLANEVFFGFKDNQTCFISATPYDPDPNSLYHTYDEVTYYDFLKDGNHLPSDVYQIGGNSTFTYDKTSDTGSAIIKFRWKEANAGSSFQLSFDREGSVAYMFGMQLYTPNEQFPNGYIWLRPGYKEATKVELPEALVSGEDYDIEFARLKVKNGEHKGDWYVYFKINDVLVSEDYVDGSLISKKGNYTTNPGSYAATVSNIIYLTFWGNGAGNKIAPSPYEEAYDAYDEVTYDNFRIDGNSLPENGIDLSVNRKVTYAATSPSYSTKLKFRWTAGTTASLVVYYDAWPNHPYGFAIKPPNTDVGGGAVAGENGAWHVNCANGGNIVQMDKPIENGETFDIEFARLLVKNGKNKGKYYVYLIVNDELIKGYYTEALADPAPSNILRFVNGTEDGFISSIPEEEEPEVPVDPEPDALYYAYDEIEYTDLKDANGNALGNETSLQGGTVLTYDRTSPTGSAIFKYRWTVGDVPKFQLSFDKFGTDTMSYMFGAQLDVNDGYPNGRMWLRPGIGPEVNLPNALAAGSTHDVEFARLKVKNGDNAGKYYVYIKIDDVLVAESYVDANVVDADGNYLSNSGKEYKISNEILFTFWGSQGNKISAIPVPETYEAYDEIGFDNLYKDGTSMSGLEIDGSGNYTYDATSPTYSVKFKYRWIAGGDKMKFTTYFDDWKYPFCFAAKTPNQSDFGAPAGENGAWHLVPSNNSHIVQMDEPIVAGKAYDVEFGRLKVKTGANAGKYYVYAKVNGELIKDYYFDGVDANGTHSGGIALSNNIIISAPAGNIFTAIPVPETYEAYDEIGFDNLYKDGTSMSGLEIDGSGNYTYDATSPTYSVKFKYRWIAGETPKFTTYFDDWKYPFCFAVKTPNQEGFGATAGPNGSWHLVPSNDSFIVDMDEPIVPGNAYDIEVGRLKVKTGANTGKYYVYFMVDGELIKDYYYDGVDANGTHSGGIALSNNIIISAPAGNKFTGIPVPVTYEDYDEIGFEDLKDENGNALEGQKNMSGGTTLTYDSTSPTGSVIFKYRWKIGTVQKFQMSFEKASDSAMSYMFGAWLSEPGADEGFNNGRMWLRPSYGPQVDLPVALGVGSSHNVEFARLKVKTGPNAGKYYVYIKIDNMLIAEDYVAANVVNANGDYITGPGDATCNVKSGEIFFAFWGSENNVISPYKVFTGNEHDGIRGDLDGDGIINAVDLVILRKILFGTIDASELTEGIADFNNDGNVDIIDLVVMKKYTAPVNSYAKSGDLVLGMQEHLDEDATKTSTYIADATATLGATAYRLSTPIHTLYYATATNEVAVREDNMAKFEEMVEALKSKGINEILYVTDSFILPYGYANSAYNHNITVPDPVDDLDNYVAWLNVNSAAFAALAEKFPEIKFFEPFNEVNTEGSRIERYGIGWNATAEEQAAHKFTVKEKAGIMADLCWYISKAVKSVDPANQVTTPSISVGSNAVIQDEFLDEFYKAIESGAYPTNQTLGDMRIDNYFTIVNIHAYADYTEDDSWFGDNFESNAADEIAEWAGYINATYDVAKNHSDGGSRVWLTETGMSTYHSDGVPRDEQNVARMIELTLEKLDEELTFIDTVIMYKIADISTDVGASASETNFGLFYSGDDIFDPYGAKPSAKAVYSFFHNGTTDYLELDALISRYVG